MANPTTYTGQTTTSTSYTKQTTVSTTYTKPSSTGSSWKPEDSDESLGILLLQNGDEILYQDSTSLYLQ